MMANGVIAILVVSTCIGIGRFFVQGHVLTGWPGLYETVAHIWSGAMLVWVYYLRPRSLIILMLVAITALEIAMYWARVGKF